MKLLTVLFLAFLSLFAMPVLAQTTPIIDTTAAVALINGDVRTAILEVAMAIIGLAAVALGVRWIKATFFS
jgi:hypothetical protein